MIVVRRCVHYFILNVRLICAGIFLVIVAAVFQSFVLAHNPLLSLQQRSCQFYLGRERVVDERGVICSWDDTSWGVSGCCNTSLTPEGCTQCNRKALKRATCCADYESCVSCCLVSRGMSFRLCKSACRTSSRVIEGIRFKTADYRYCLMDTT